jgi:hypothetical protein
VVPTPFVPAVFDAHFYLELTKQSDGIRGGRSPNMQKASSSAGYGCDRRWLDQLALLITIPMATFLLFLVAMLLISLVFTYEARRALIETELRGPEKDRNVIAPLFDRFYAELYNDLLFLGRLPDAKTMINATSTQSTDYQQAKQRLRVTIKNLVET